MISEALPCQMAESIAQSSCLPDYSSQGASPIYPDNEIPKSFTVHLDIPYYFKKIFLRYPIRPDQIIPPIEALKTKSR